MRIISGKHRGRRLQVPRGAQLRPTADRVREAVFNILRHHPDVPDLDDAVILDVFAGTGACGLEALSRGAALAVFVDRDPVALKGIRSNAAALNEAESAVLLRLDATRLAIPPPAVPPRSANAPAAIAFLDAPYGSGSTLPALEGLKSGGWIKPGAMCVVEVSAREAFAPPSGYTLLDERTYGAARVAFLRAD